MAASRSRACMFAYHDNDVAEHGGNSPNSMSTETYSLVFQRTSLIWNIYIVIYCSQLTKVEVSTEQYYVTIRDFRLRAHRGLVFLKLTTARVLIVDCIAGSNPVNLFY